MNGFFNLNKPLGISSAKAVWQVKNKFKIKDKIGHMGTLDPLASGVLVVAIGRANRLFDKMLDKTKQYITTFDFGYQTASIDKESEEIVFKSDIIPNLEQINAILPDFLGEQLQTAPIYSAKNINGQRAYHLARRGENIEIKPHKITIYDIKCLKQISETAFEFEITCSGGTYIRSICRDLANKLNTYATMIELKRTKCGVFDILNSKNIEDIEESDLYDMGIALNDLSELSLEEEIVQKIKDGKIVQIEKPDGEYCVKLNGLTIGIGKIADKIIKIKPCLL
ncbi:MAG: tRNA pseudouridine(55) synthase TruB [Clostridia bacterium]|nr:tRNA pseudouridine(55) synthase TruB [Clostridia bacterium]